MSDAGFGSVAKPVPGNPWAIITQVHWRAPGVVAVVTLEGQITSIDIGRTGIGFTALPTSGNTVTINGKVIAFGTDVTIGPDTDATALNLANFITGPPVPVPGVHATAEGSTTLITYDDTLTMKKSGGAAIVLNGPQFVEDPFLAPHTVIDSTKYDGIGLYDPLGNLGAVNVGEDLVLNTYTQIIGPSPPTFTVNNTYAGRFRRSMIVNFNNVTTGEIDINAPVTNNYIFISPGIFPVRLSQEADQKITVSYYPFGTKFTLGTDGTLTTDTAATSSFSKTVPVQDTRPAPLTSGAISAYNSFHFAFPYASVKFNRSGEVT